MWTVKELKNWLETCSDDDIIYIFKNDNFYPLNDGEIITESEID